MPEPGQTDLRGFEWYVLNNQHNVAGRPIASIGADVYDIKFSPDKRWLAVSGKDAVIRLFDAETFVERGTIETGQKEVNGLAFAHDSLRLASAGDDGTVVVWDIASRAELVRFKAHDGVAFQVAFSPDSRLIATCGAGNIVRLWNSTTGAGAGSRNKHTKGNIEAIIISPNGAIVSAGSDGRLLVGPLAKGPIQRRFGRADSARISSLAISPGALLAWAQVDGTLHFSLDDGVVDYRMRLPDGCQSLAFSHKKEDCWLAVGDRAGGIRILPVLSGERELEAVRQWSAHGGRVYALAVAPDGRRVISGGADGRVMIWEPFPPESEIPSDFREGWMDYDVLRDGRLVVSRWNRLYLCDRQFRVLATHDTRVSWLKVAADGGLVFYKDLGRQNSLAVWNPANGSTETVWEEPETPDAIGDFATTSDGAGLFVMINTVTGPNRILRIDVASHRIVETISFETMSKNMALSPDGRRLAFQMGDDLCVYDVTARRIACRWKAARHGFLRLCFSADSARLATAASNRTVSIWDPESGELLFDVTAHRQYASDVCFSPDGSRLATFGADNVIRVWDGRSASPLLEWPTTQNDVQRLRFLDNYRLIAPSVVGSFLLLDGAPGGRSAGGEAH